MVTDIRMPPTHTDEGIRLAAMLRDSHPDIGVVVLSNYADPAYALALLESGSEGRAYLLKERVHDRAQLRSAIHAVARRAARSMDPKIVEPLMLSRGGDGAVAARRAHAARARGAGADRRRARATRRSPSRSFLTKRAVEKHINAIFLKLNLAGAEDVSKRVKATLMFLAEDGGTPAASGAAAVGRSRLRRRSRPGR